ncbi:hypothetical protein GCM10007049_04500 [Echinicola pacifica]|uniref:Uncharacterized protein n=1 Tax=Echinicola pacifica TaxID=346377 RepID=A0A918UJ18_9BACT|nr:hypothetical protein GCM10007049_04500 [Echinicola pacifica]
MDTAFTLVLLTLAYGLCLLSFYPEKYLRKLGYKTYTTNTPEYKKLRLSEPLFLSLLGGYIMAFVVMVFFK